MINNQVILTLPHTAMMPPALPDTRRATEAAYALATLNWSDYVTCHAGNTSSPEAVRLSAVAAGLKEHLYGPTYVAPDLSNNPDYVRNKNNWGMVQDARIKREKALALPRDPKAIRTNPNLLGVCINGVRLARTDAPPAPHGFKVCLHCGGEPQPYANFSQNVTKCDGRRAECKACQKKERDEKADARRVLLGQAPRPVTGVLQTCEYPPCDKSFKRPNRAEHGVKHYCSLDCYDNARGAA